MGIRIQKRQWRDCLLLRISGCIHARDCERIYQQLKPDGSETMPRKLYYDLEDVPDIVMTFVEMNTMIGLRRRTYGDSNGTRIAVWAPTDITFGMSRMYSALLGQFDTVNAEVFRTRDKAADFLDMPPDVLIFPGVEMPN